MIAFSLTPDVWRKTQLALELFGGLFWIIQAFVDFRSGNKKAWLDLLIAGLFFGASSLSVKIDRVDEQEKRALSDRVSAAEGRAGDAEKAKNEAVAAAGIASSMASSARQDAAKLHERTITPGQRAKFVSFLANVPQKKSVWVVADDSSGAGRRLASSLRSMMDDTGFSVDVKDRKSMPGVAGMSTRNGVLETLNPVLSGNGGPDTIAVLVFCSLDVSNKPPHGTALYNAFRAAEIPFLTLTSETNFIASGEVVIIVP